MTLENGQNYPLVVEVKGRVTLGDNVGGQAWGCSRGAGHTPDLDLGGAVTLWRNITMSLSGLHSSPRGFCSNGKHKTQVKPPPKLSTSRYTGPLVPPVFAKCACQPSSVRQRRPAGAAVRRPRPLTQDRAPRSWGSVSLGTRHGRQKRYAGFLERICFELIY